jgi:exosortase/archaeosortase family protein
LKELLFPILLLLLLTPPPQEYLYSIGSFLSTTSSSFAHQLLVLLNTPSSLTFAYGTPILLLFLASGETITLAIDIACSGIHSQLGFLTFAIFTAYLMKGKLWKKALILVLGFPLMFLLNGLRIALIALIGFNFGTDLALSTVHATGGWILAFIGTLVLLLISEKGLGLHISLFNAPGCSEHVFANSSHCCSACGEIVVTPVNELTNRDLMKIVGIFGCVLLILSIQAPLFTLTEGPAEVIIQTAHGAEATTDIFSSLPDYNVHFVQRNEEFETRYNQDASLEYVLNSTNNGKKDVWIALEIAESRYSLHRWEVCLIEWPLGQGSSPQATLIEDVSDVVLQENPLILGRFFIFTWHRSDVNNLNQTTLYWYETSAVMINSTVSSKHMKISLVAYPEHVEEIPALKTQLFEVASQIVTTWQSTKSWSRMTLFMQKYIDEFFILFTALTAIFAVLQLRQDSRDTRMRRSVYNKLSAEKQLIINAVHQTKDDNARPPLNAITQTYNAMSGQTATESEILKMLSATEDAGLIKRDITNRNDRPVQTWRRSF